MKKYLLSLAMMLAFAVGCQTDTTTNVALEGKDTVLTISLEQARTSLGSKGEDGIYPYYWSEGDKLVVNGALSDEVQIDAENRASATFRFSEAALTYPYHITYPYCASATESSPVVEFPTVQSYAEGSFATNTVPMCGYVDGAGDNIKLNHLAAILRFSIKAESEGVVLKKVVITSTSGAKLSGEFEVDCKNTTISATEGCGSSVTYTLPADYRLSTTTPSDLFVVLPALEVGACTIEFIEASGARMVANWAPNAPLAKGVVREFNNITYRPLSVITLPSMPAEEDELIIFRKKYPGENEIKIMSFNVRTETTEEVASNNWVNRKEACVMLIKDHMPSIIGFQEAKYTSQWLYLKEQLSDLYDGYGVNRDTGGESGKGEVMGILYNKSVIQKIDGGTFWLSETPDVPSKGFGADYSRNATWGLFKHIPTGSIFYYINTHLDHKVANAQIEGMKLISQHFEEYIDTYPVFMTGDLNITSDNVALDVIESYMYNARDAAPAEFSDYNPTYNGYKTPGRSIIDHIYCSDYLRVVEYHTINEQYGDVNFVSDHYPIYAIIKLQ